MELIREVGELFGFEFKFIEVATVSRLERITFVIANFYERIFTVKFGDFFAVFGVFFDSGNGARISVRNSIFGGVTKEFFG